MNVRFYFASKGYERALLPALTAGAALHGDTIEMVPIAEYDGPRDVGLICGVVKREILWDHQRAGVDCLYLDKGVIRERMIWQGANLPGWWRICINAVHATSYMMDVARAPVRLALMPELIPSTPRRVDRPTDHILIAGSSAKFHHTSNLPHPTIWAGNLVSEIRRYTDLPIVLRPKPSWSDAEPVEGARFDHGQKTSIETALRDARCMITYGSIASVDAIRAGVPCIVLGNAPARPVSGTTVESLVSPYWAPDAARMQWAANLAYSNFRVREVQDGTAWGIVKSQLELAHAGV